MTKLDEAGLAAAKAAYKHAGRHWQAVPKAITAYLDATHTSDALRDLQRLGQECEGDRLAVVTDSYGAAVGWTFSGPEPSPVDWNELEVYAEGNWGQGPWRRQIVTIPGGLLRPEPVGEVVGSVEDA